MDYEKKYKEALERMKSWARGEHPECFSEAQKAAEFIFPEIKESEDERIRKAIMSCCIDHGSKYKYLGVSMEEMCAWLEKQGQTFTKKDVDDAYLKGVCDTKQELEKQGETTRTDIEIPFGAYDSELQEVSYNIPEGFSAVIKDDRVVIKKIGPKFNVGDWVVFIASESIYQVEKIENYEYTLRHILGGSLCLSFSDEKLIREWTIADARDGDVLATWVGAFIYNGQNGGSACPGSYCGINTLGKFQTGTEHHWTSKKVYPATKEQRDLLFQKMKEAGYEWDNEKKELRKIDAYQLSENPCSNCTNTKGCITCVNGDHKSTATPRILYSNEVIEWLDEHVPTKFEDMQNYVNQFKKDFEL